MSSSDPTLLHLEAELARLDARLHRTANSHAALPPPPGLDPHVLQESRLVGLANAFGLSTFEVELLLLALAPALDGRFGRRYGEWLDDPTARRPTVGLALSLLAADGVTRLQRLRQMTAAAPLLQHQLILLEGDGSPGVTPLVEQSMAVDPTVVAWLLGRYQPAAAIARAEWSLPDSDSADAALCAAVWPDLLRAMNGQSLTCFYGPDPVTQMAAARQIAAGLQSPLLTVDLKAALRQGTPPAQAVRLALRDARLTGAIACLQGIDAALDLGEGGGAADPLRSPGASLLPEVQHLLLGYPDLLITVGRTAWMPRGATDRRTILWHEFPLPGYGERTEIWRHFLGEATTSPGLDPAVLAGLFRFTAGQIRDVALAARDFALARGPEAELARDDVLAAARAYSGAKLDELARRITPRHHWADLVLRPDQIASLQEVLAMVRRRSQVLDGWGVGRKLSAGAAVTMLFAGEPGTGKTMAAEVMAGELGLELYKVDLAALVSKYIGETEKNLEQIFREAEQGNAILFFDEADAIFGKRSGIKDSHDRYANIGISYLLQRMEAYDGVTILATNLRSNLDEAFLRRLHAVIDFPFPDEAARLRMWEVMFPPDLPRAEDVDFGQIAKRYPLSGGGIRNVIVHAAFLAAEAGEPVNMAHLTVGLRREYQKLGRLMHEGELQLAPPTPSPPRGPAAGPTANPRPPRRPA